MFSRIIVTGLTLHNEELTIVQPAKILTPEGSCVRDMYERGAERLSS